MEAKAGSELNFKTKFFYGMGIASGEIYSIALGSLLLFFLTSTVGLNPTLAGSVVVIGRIWDAINDPFLGWLSDQTISFPTSDELNQPKRGFRERISNVIGAWGKRYPWMMLGPIPLAIFLILLWSIPPFQDPWLLVAYYTGVLLLSDTAVTAIKLPYDALAAELTETYTERISLMGFRSFFNVITLLGYALVSQVIFASIQDPSQRYLVFALVEGAFITAAVYLCIWGTHQQYRERIQRRLIPHAQTVVIPFWESLRFQLNSARRSKPLLITAVLICCTGITSNLTITVLPYFVTVVMTLPEQDIFKVLLAAQGVALLSVFLWNWIGQWVGKRGILFLGLPVWMMAHVGLFFLQPGQDLLLYLCVSIAGLGFATALLAPWSMLPDIIDFDELNTGQRREGMFYSLIVQAQKLALALAIFSVGRILDVSGFISQTAGTEIPEQPAAALLAVRLLISFFPAILLAIGLILTYIYPITRQAHQEIVLKLQEAAADQTLIEPPHLPNS